MPISSDVFILSASDLDARETSAYKRGVERGRFEERAALGREEVAMNCKNWKDGYCDHCGAQHQGCQVNALFKCPHFVRR